jgi:nicotinate-nucleotide adenylyltransferase
VDRVLLFGGSFNPIHNGHLIVARAAAEQLAATRVILVPSAVPPHKQDRRLAPAADRLEMCRRAVAGEPGFEVSNWELGRPGPNYTLHTVEHFAGQLAPPDSRDRWFWLVGMDSLHELHTWYRAAELVERCTIVTAARPGSSPPTEADLGRHFSPPQVARLLAHVLQTPHVEIASTEIRRRVAAGLSIRYLVPETVSDCIAATGLYRSGH